MNPTQLITTGSQAVDAILIVLGGLGSLATLGATVLPAKWAFTQFLARIAADLRNIRGTAKPSTPANEVRPL